MDKFQWPAPLPWLTRAYERILPASYADVILGDLHEGFVCKTGRIGRRRAAWWYLAELARATPALLTLIWLSQQRGRFRMSSASINVRPAPLLALLGAFLSVPAIGLVSGGLLQSAAGNNGVTDLIYGLLGDGIIDLMHPAVILGGLTLGFGLNLWPFLRAGLPATDLVGTTVLRLRTAWPNTLYVAFCLGCAGVIVLYLVLENGLLLIFR